MLPKRASVGLGVIAFLLFSSVGVNAAPSLSLDPWRLCPQAIATAERTQAIPKHLLSAIALAESGRKHPTLDKRMPWPWTVMAEGQGRYLATKQAAIEEVRQLQARGIANIDVGCMQVNLYYHPDAFLSLEQAFDPVANVAYAGRFLRSLFADSGAWDEAAGRYHSATPGLKDPYRDKVVQIWQREQRMELAGSTTFGSGSLTAGADRGLPGAAAGSRVRSPALLLSMADGRMGVIRRAPAGRNGLDGMRTIYSPRRSGQTGADAMRASYPPSGSSRVPDVGRAYRTLDEEAAFASRRAQYLQELREAIAQVKRLSAVEIARDYSRNTAAFRSR
jgi:hypothetical protein